MIRRRLSFGYHPGLPRLGVWRFVDDEGRTVVIEIALGPLYAWWEPRP